MWLNWSLIYLLVGICQTSGAVTVEIEEGLLKGEVLEASTGYITYFSFKGIPYAQPPVGRLRFKAPAPAIKWSGVRSAKKFGSSCIQRNYFTNEIVLGSEDCLYLNVYSPNLTPIKKMAVIIYVHGGGFLDGDSSYFGPEFLMNYEVVLVTTNYRLGPLGFLSLETKEVPGNAGVKDVIAAMRWVKKNIGKFGGDPDNVTIMGQSSGGAMVSFLTVSPLASSLFKRAIVMSGTFLNDYALAYVAKQREFALGKNLGLDTKNVTELYEFLLKAPAKNITSANPIVLMGDNKLIKFRRVVYFPLVIERDFKGEHVVTEDPDNLLRSHKTKKFDVMVGHTIYEATRIDNAFEKDISKYYPKYSELFTPVKVKRISTPKTAVEIGNKVIDYYYGNKTGTMRETILFDTDYNYVYDIFRYINAIPDRRGSKKYYYEFTYFSDRNVYAKVGLKYGLKGATHAEDLFYLFNLTNVEFPPLNKSSEDFKIIKRQSALITNFAKHGNPTPDGSLGAVWKQYKQKERNKLVMGPTLQSTLVSYDGSLGFWKKILTSSGFQF